MWKSTAEITVDLNMCIAFWICKATSTRTTYVLLIAFPQQYSFIDLPQGYAVCKLAALLYDGCPDTFRDFIKVSHHLRYS